METNRLTFSDTTVSFACPAPLRLALREAATRQVTCVSEFVRRACVKELEAVGVVIARRNDDGEPSKRAELQAG